MGAGSVRVQAIKQPQPKPPKAAIFQDKEEAQTFASFLGWERFDFHPTMIIAAENESAAIERLVRIMIRCLD
jgi:hypothetical protein